MGKMRYYLKLLSEAAKAAGRILAGLALLNYRVCLIALKIGMLLQAGLAILRMAGGFHRWMCAPLGLAAYGVCQDTPSHRPAGQRGRADCHRSLCGGAASHVFRLVPGRAGGRLDR